MKKRSRYMLKLCLGLLFGSILLWYFCGYVVERSQKNVWSYFNTKVKIIHSVTGVPYEKLINEYAVKAGLNPQLVAAIIKAESSYRAGAVSPYKAYGLMQIMPETWQQINREIHAHSGPVTVARLTDPELNIYIGTTYFAKLVKQYQGNFILALAAYNAGPQAVNQYQTVPPFAETTEYVNRIMCYWYELADEQPPQTVDREYWLRLRGYAAKNVMIMTMVLLVMIWHSVAVKWRRWR